MLMMAFSSCFSRINTIRGKLGGVFKKLYLTINGKIVTAKLMEDMWVYFCNGKEDN